MRKLSIFILAILAMACNSESDNKKASISGKILNSNADTLYLEELTTSAVNVLDSVILDKNGEFELNLRVPKLGFYRLINKKNNFIIFVLDSMDHVNIQADASNLAKTYQIEGSKNSKLVWELNQHQVKIYQTQDSLQKVYLKYQNNPIADSIGKELNNCYELAVASFQDQVRSYVRKYPDAFATLLAIENLDVEKDLALYQQVEKNLLRKYKDSEYVSAFSRRLSELTRLKIGSAAPEIKLPDTQGNLFSLSSLKGKVVLIDFWASWCKPCRMENPNVVKLYEKYQTKGFEILGVSLDKDKKVWLEAIEQDQLKWKHISDLAFWNSAAVQLYNLTSIPFTVLIDKNGNIIAKNLRGEELDQKLQQILQ
jgi:peroxiredoxin